MIKHVSLRSLADFVSDKAAGLTAYLHGIYKGQTATKRTPLYKSVEPDVILNRWLGLLNPLADEDATLFNFDSSKESKGGPQGGYPGLNDRDEDLEAYFKERDDKGFHRLLERRWPLSEGKVGTLDDGIRFHSSKLFDNKRGLRPRSYDGLVSFMASKHKLDTNSGLPDFSRRKGEDIWKRAISDAESGKGRSYPAVIGSRSSRGKARFIFMFPMSTNLVEASFTYEPQNYLMMNREANISHPSNIFAAWRGFDAVERVVKLQYESLGINKNARHVIVGVDYTKMDTTVRKGHSQMLFKLLSPIFQKSYLKQLNESINGAQDIPILLTARNGKGLVTNETHGYASGSGGTNFGESLISYLLHEYFIIRGKEIHNEDIKFGINQVNGDDGLLSFYTNVDDNNISNTVVEIMKEFGFDANPEKQEISDDHGIYLQRIFQVARINKEYGPGIYPTVQALNTLVYPERFHSPSTWNAKMETLRGIMILENCSRHPMFHQFVKFVMKGDKLKLGLADPENFSKFLLEMETVSKTAHTLNPSYNRFSYGLRDFEVIKYLRSKI